MHQTMLFSFFGSDMPERAMGLQPRPGNVLRI